MKKLAAFCCLTILILAGTNVVAADSRPWIHLGNRTVTDRADHDVFVLKGPARELRAIKITVKKRAVEFRRVKITFADGSSQELSVNRVIPARGSSRPIDLVGGRRVVTKVEFWYDAQSFGKKAAVRLFGLRA